MHIFVVLQTAFSLWMLVDAVKRGVESYWYLIVMVPFGEFVYFFAIKINDPEFRALKQKLLTRPVSLKDLEYNSKNSPSVKNKLELAEAYHDRGKFAQALGLFAEVLVADQDDRCALYGLAACRMGLKQPEQAMTALEKLVDIDLAYNDYSGSCELAMIYWENDKKERAIELLSRVVKKGQRLHHTVLLAEYLAQMERVGDARNMLEKALEDYEHSPAFSKKRDRRHARQARRILKMCRA